MAALPTSARLREVGPRDGFQNEPETIPTADKVRLIGMLGAAGYRRIELTSFVRADVIPQLADANDVLDSYEKLDGVAYSVLIPNEKGLENALARRERFDEVNLFLSASETHNQKNVNRSIEESLSGLERVIERALCRGPSLRGRDLDLLRLPVRGRTSRLSGSSRSPSACARRGARRSRSATPREWRIPARWASSSPQARERLEGAELTAHFHNTRGQGLANVLAALEQGIDSFESAFGELGGCPVPPGATGNISSEDLVSMLEEMGVDTGIDLEKLIAASGAVQDVLGRPLGAHVLRAGPVDWHTTTTN